LILVFVFGAVFLGVLLLLSVVFPNPTKFTYEVCKVILAIATACIATLLSGFVNIEIDGKEFTLPIKIKAGGAFAIFVIVFFFNPASEVILEPWNSSFKRRSKSTRRPSRFDSPIEWATRTTPLTPQRIETYSRISISGHRKPSSLGKWGIKKRDGASRELMSALLCGKRTSNRKQSQSLIRMSVVGSFRRIAMSVRVSFGIALKRKPPQQRQLGNDKYKGQTHQAKDLEVNPEIGALCPPDCFI
jgi:hypothetical protein